jgi:hypothetical protein
VAKPVDKRAEIREAAEADLLTFIRLVAPKRMLGAVHEELCRWWQRADALDNQLVLLPRDHQKSALIAYRVAWWITKHPDVMILYVSATADLAEKQLTFIKNILTCDAYRYYWPEMVDISENKRARWTSEEFAVDHPKRKEEGVRDPTCKAVGITANTTGLHCNVAVLDDVVVPGNDTEQGRIDVRAFYSQLSSIETTGAKEWCVGTRYHPADLYRDMMEMTEEYEDPATGEWISTKVYEVFERKVEVGGVFLWPKAHRDDGKHFGFDERELARKKAKYLDIRQFYAQYYNDPNVAETAQLNSTRFQYYDREQLKQISGVWYLGDKILNVYASVDFAYSISKTADYTAIVVVGVDAEGFIYVLDIERFKTNRISVMYEQTLRLFRKWRFKKLRAECTLMQSLVVEQFKEHMRREEIQFSIDEYRPPANRSKEDRVNSTLEPRYANQTIWHYRGGFIPALEEELVMAKPEHDDLKDALASVIEIAKAPAKVSTFTQPDNIIYSGRFGGVAYR